MFPFNSKVSTSVVAARGGRGCGPRAGYWGSRPGGNGGAGRKICGPAVDAIPQCEGRQGVVAEALDDRGGARFGRFFLMVSW